jgi:hypothetical protein
MIRVIKNSSYWLPRDANSFLKEHPEIWDSLNKGNFVDLTEEQVKLCKKTIKVIEIIKPIKIKTSIENNPKKATQKPIINLKHEESRSVEDTKEETL